jgi:glycine cleavage system H protein
MTVKYTEDHEWIRLDDDGLATVGITNYAQGQLGDMVFVELPEADREVAQGEETAVIESVKAAGEVKAPVAGTVVKVNDALTEDPSLVNSDPEGEGWFLRIRIADENELAALLDEDAYQTMVADLG